MPGSATTSLMLLGLTTIAESTHRVLLPARRLLVEFAPSPAVVDSARPRFSWHVPVSPGLRGASPAGYRVQVCQQGNAGGSITWDCAAGCSATTGATGAATADTTVPAAAADVQAPACAWDSGRVNSSAHWGITYGGQDGEDGGDGGGAAMAVALASDSTYGWRVKWWARTSSSTANTTAAAAVDPELEADWSAVARMDTAFVGGVAGLPDGASWIGSSPAAFAAAPLGTTQLRTTFSLPAGAVVTRARAYVASPGYYTLQLDGRDADDTVLGAFTVFTRRILYDAIDVTALLGAAAATGDAGGAAAASPSGPVRHAVAITLANGWYSQPTVGLGPRMVSVVLRINYTVADTVRPHAAGHSGSLAVVSGGAWRETHGPTTSNDFYPGVVHDARLETPGWLLPNYTEAGTPGRWGAAAVLDSPLLPRVGTLRVAGMPAIRRCETFAPRSVRWFGAAQASPNPPGWVVDFGQNIAGTVELSIPASVLRAAQPGTNITIQHAETVHPDGTLHHLYGSPVTELTTYIVGDATTWGSAGAVFEPRHSYSGFRYVAISGSALGPAAGGPLPVSVAAHFVHSDLEQTGQLSTSSALVNSIVRAAQYSQLGNWMSLPTDCTQRERRGWLGDAQLAAEGQIHSLFAAAAYAKFLDDIADTQADEWAVYNGSVPEVCPNYGHGPIPPDPPFGVGYAVLWWNQYRYYGDSVALARHYAGVKAFAETLIEQADGGGGGRAGVLRASTHGDWVSVANDSVGATTCSGRAALDHHANATCCRFMECPDPVVSGFYYVTQLRILAAAATVLGQAADATRYTRLAADAAASLAAAEYSAADQVLGYGYQTDQAMALALGSPGGVLPPGDRAALAAELAADVARRGGHLNTGIFGTKVLLPALSSTGWVDQRRASVDARGLRGGWNACGRPP